MIRIGIIGRNSHAMNFATYFNTPNETGKYPFDNIRVTAICADTESAAPICAAANIDTVVENPEDLLGKVDAVMNLSRHGSMHLEQTMPFVQAGLPLFIDKPFSSDVSQAEQLLSAICSRRIPVMGGSDCKYYPQVQKLREQVIALRQEKKLISASIAFTIMDSPYEGFWFYAPHLVEMALEVFGYGPLSVSAVEHEQSVVATLYYPDTIVTLHFCLNMWDSSCVLYTKDGVCFTKLTGGNNGKDTAERFGNMLLGAQQPQPYELLTSHVHIIDAILRSIQSSGMVVSL